MFKCFGHLVLTILVWGVKICSQPKFIKAFQLLVILQLCLTITIDPIDVPWWITSIALKCIFDWITPILHIYLCSASKRMAMSFGILCCTESTIWHICLRQSRLLFAAAYNLPIILYNFGLYICKLASLGIPFLLCFANFHELGGVKIILLYVHSIL